MVSGARHACMRIEGGVVLAFLHPAVHRATKVPFDNHKVSKKDTQASKVVRAEKSRSTDWN